MVPTLDQVEKLVRQLQDQFREQAMGASQNTDLVEAQKEQLGSFVVKLSGTKGYRCWWVDVLVRSSKYTTYNIL